MKKVFGLIFLLIVILFSGCNLVEAIEITNNDSEIVKSRSEEIIRCFDERDSESIKKMMCSETISNVSDIDEQIQSAFEIYEGKSESYEVVYAGMAGSMQEGVWTDKHTSVKIKDIATDSGGKYIISYTEYFIYDDDENRVGVIAISLRNDNGDLLVGIGER